MEAEQSFLVVAGWVHCQYKMLGLFPLHWCLLDQACSSVKPGEAGEGIWLISTQVFAPLTDTGADQL
jgi:hypothetical protein